MLSNKPPPKLSSLKQKLIFLQFCGLTGLNWEAHVWNLLQDYSQRAGGAESHRKTRLGGMLRMTYSHNWQLMSATGWEHSWGSGPQHLYVASPSW